MAKMPGPSELHLSHFHKRCCLERQGKEQTEHVRWSEEFGKRTAIRNSDKSNDSFLFMLTF